MKEVEAIAAASKPKHMWLSRDEAERQRLWAGRKAAFPAIGRLTPDYYCMDGTIPRRKLPEVLGRIREYEKAYGLPTANVFHAGDGNLHPLIFYDANEPGHLEKAEHMGADILKLCVEVGGVLTGEHGVGIEKRDLMSTMFDAVDLGAAAPYQARLRPPTPASTRGENVPARFRWGHTRR